jgi:hypothetical protein
MINVEYSWAYSIANSWKEFEGVLKRELLDDGHQAAVMQEEKNKPNHFALDGTWDAVQESMGKPAKGHALSSSI